MTDDEFFEDLSALIRDGFVLAEVEDFDGAIPRVHLTARGRAAACEPDCFRRKVTGQVSSKTSADGPGNRR